MVLSVILPCEERLRRTVLPDEAERFRVELDAERPTEAERLTVEAAPERDEMPEPALPGPETVRLIRPVVALREMAPAPERETEVLPIPMP